MLLCAGLGARSFHFYVLLRDGEKSETLFKNVFTGGGRIGGAGFVGFPTRWQFLPLSPRLSFTGLEQRTITISISQGMVTAVILIGLRDCRLELRDFTRWRDSRRGWLNRLMASARD